MPVSGVEPRTLRARAAAASFTSMKHRIAPPLAALLLISLAACSQPAPPVANAPEVAGEPIPPRAVMFGPDTPRLPPRSRIRHVKAGRPHVDCPAGQTTARQGTRRRGAPVTACDEAREGPPDG